MPDVIPQLPSRSQEYLDADKSELIRAHAYILHLCHQPGSVRELLSNPHHLVVRNGQAAGDSRSSLSLLESESDLLSRDFELPLGYNFGLSCDSFGVK
jgi:hypothetical protein